MHGDIPTQRELSFVAIFVDELINVCLFGVWCLVERVDGEEKEGAAVSRQRCNFSDLRQVHA